MRLIEDGAPWNSAPMRVIGITGGVGAGKSEILNFLEQAYGARVVQADAVGHLVMEPGTRGYQKVVEAFGARVLCREGKHPIDRGILGSIVFADPAKRELLNGIIHPEVKAWIRGEIEEVKRAGNCRLFVVEAALLIEDHYEEICDELWYIHASEDVRRERLKDTRGYTDERVTAIFESQQPECVFRERCQAVIENEGSIEEAHAQIVRLLAAGEGTKEKES